MTSIIYTKNTSGAIRKARRRKPTKSYLLALSKYIKFLKSLGFNIIIFPGGAVRAATFQLQEYYAGLLENGSNTEFSKRMHDFDSLNAVIGTPELLSIGKKYE